MACESCGDKPKKCNKDFTRAVVEIDNPEQIALMRKVTIPASMGDDTTVPPAVGKYHNVLLYYEANQKSYLYSSDGIPTQLTNGITDYEAATNLPQINSHTLIGDKTGDQLGLQDKLTAGDNITIENNVISATDTTYGPATDTEIGLVKPGDGLSVDTDGTLGINAGDGLGIDSDNNLNINVGEGVGVDSSDNLYAIKYTFDTVADMKASTDLIDGDYTKTGGFYSVNDNGSALYKIRQITNDDIVDEKFIIELADNSLIAELITGKMVNICQVGGQQNFSDVCNYIISAGKNIYVPGGDYEASSTIIFSNPSQMFVCDGNISFTGSSSTLFSVRASYNIIKLNGIIEAGATNDCIRICDGSNATYSSEIYIHRIRTCRNGIMINPDSTVGCQCSDFTFGRIAASNAGIYIQAGDTGTPWVSASRFRGGEISAPYGIVTRKGANQTDNFNDLSFSRITFSGSIECALDLQFCGRCYFRELRIAEGLVGTYCIKLDASGYNIIENEYEIELSKVLITNETSSTSRNFIYAKCITDGGSYVGYRADTYKGHFIIPRSELLRPDKVYLGGSDGTFTTTPNFYYDGMTVMINSSNYGQTYNYTLPDPISQQGIKEFYLKVARQRSDITNTLTDQNGKVVTVPSGALENVWYRAYLRNDTYGNAVWKLEEV